jgi:hypothetical protein
MRLLIASLIIFKRSESLCELLFSVCHSEAKPKNLGLISSFANQMLHIACPE